MATPVQRATSILTAILNGTPTNPQITKAGEAFSMFTGVEDPTANQKAEAFIKQVRMFVLAQVHLYEEQSGVAAAKLAAASTVAAEFPESP